MTECSLKTRFIAVNIERRKTKGGTRYYLRYKADKRECVPAGKKASLARQKRLELENELNGFCILKQSEVKPEVQNKTFDEFWKLFTEAVEGKLKVRTIESYKTCLGNFRKAFPGKFNLQDITSYDAELYSSKRLKEIKAITAKKEIRHLKSLFKRAKKWGIIRNNPFDGLTQIKDTERNQRKKDMKTVTPKEEEDLIRAIERNRNSQKTELRKLKQKAIIKIAVQGGLRNCEIRHLRWMDIDLATGQVSITCREDWTTKSGMDRIVFVDNDALGYLAKLKLIVKTAGDKDMPFIYDQSSTLSRIFGRIARNADVKCTLHDLRRTCASRLAKVVTPQIHMEYMGHVNLQTTMEYYTEIDLDTLKDAMKSARAAASKKGFNPWENFSATKFA